MATQYRPSQQRRALEANLLGLCAAMALAAPAFLAAPSPAAATIGNPITYDLSPSVMGAVPGGTDTVTGTFVFDPTASTLDSVDLTVTGPIFPGVYDEPEGGAPALAPPNEINVINASAAFSLIFQNSLGNATDPVTAFNFFSPSPVDFTVMQGAAVPVSTAVPEPATWAMALLGFAGLGFAAHRRAKLKASMGFSAA
jgi:hypothetical protein